MANQLSKDKNRYSFAFKKDFINNLDNHAEKENKTRTEVVKLAIEQLLDPNTINYSIKELNALKSEINDLKNNINNLINDNSKLRETTVHQAADIHKYLEENGECVSQIAALTNKIAYLENRGLWARIMNKKQNKKLLE